MIRKIRAADKRLLTILLIVFVQMVGSSMVLPILPLYAQRQFDISPQVITLLVSSFFLAQFLAGPYIGRMSDRSGRVLVLIISQIGTTIAFAMIGLAQSVEILFIARILDGITGGNIIVAQAYVTDVTPPTKRTEALGYVFGAIGLGLAFGPALGGGLSALFGARVPFLLAAVASLVTVLLTWLLLDETLSKEQQQSNRTFNQAGLGARDILTNIPMVLILIVTFVGQFAFGILISTFALFGEAVLFADYDADAVNLGVGLLLAIVGIGQFFTQMVLLPWLVKRTDDGSLVVIGSILRTISMLIYSALTTPVWAGIASASFAMGQGTTMPPLQSLVTRTVSDKLRGGILGVFQSVSSLATILSTALAGVLFAIHPTVPYWISTGLFAASLLLAVAVRRWSQAQKQDRPKLAPKG
ncbi:MAG: MFS transporter [Anaerolineales bacterium]|nr:MFS transporter [Anaerolineales bacterium]MCB0026876.1 MFS transporter [Anaerolineales bacterium]